MPPRALELFRLVSLRHTRAEALERLRAPVGELLEAVDRWCAAEFEWASVSVSVSDAGSGSGSSSASTLTQADVPHLQSLTCALFPGARETERERDADPADGRRALVTAAATFIAFIGRLVDRAAQRLTQPPARVVSIAAWRSQLGGLVSSLEQLQCCLVNALLNFLFQCHLSNSGDQTLTQTLSQTGASKQANPGAAQRLPASDSSTFQLTNEFVNSILLLFRTFKSMLIAKSPIIHVCA